jgi:hypothetical protein
MGLKIVSAIVAYLQVVERNVCVWHSRDATYPTRQPSTERVSECNARPRASHLCCIVLTIAAVGSNTPCAPAAIAHAGSKTITSIINRILKYAYITAIVKLEIPTRTEIRKYRQSRIKLATCGASTIKHTQRCSHHHPMNAASSSASFPHPPSPQPTHSKVNTNKCHVLLCANAPRMSTNDY